MNCGEQRQEEHFSCNHSAPGEGSAVTSLVPSASFLHLRSIFFFFFLVRKICPELASTVNLPLFVCEPPSQHGPWQTRHAGLHLGTEPGQPKQSTPNLTTRPLGLAIVVFFIQPSQSIQLGIMFKMWRVKLSAIEKCPNMYCLPNSLLADCSFPFSSSLAHRATLVVEYFQCIMEVWLWKLLILTVLVL